MNEPIHNEQTGYEANKSELEELPACDADLEMDPQLIYDELSEMLENAIPGEIYTMVREMQPIEAAVKTMWQLGGRILGKYPGMELMRPYPYPEEVEKLQGTIGAYSFTVAKSPIRVLTAAAIANIDADKEAIKAYELDRCVPLIIKKGKEVERIGLIDFKEHLLELTVGLGFSISIDLGNNPSRDKLEMQSGLAELEDSLDELEELAERPPSLFNNAEEEQAITEWCEKHSYSIRGVIRSSIDCYQ